MSCGISHRVRRRWACTGEELLEIGGELEEWRGFDEDGNREGFGRL